MADLTGGEGQSSKVGFTMGSVENATRRTSAQLKHAALWADRDHRKELRLLGSKRRLLQVPKPRLKQVQKALTELLGQIPRLPCVFGCSSRGPRDNAAAHRGHPYVQVVDVRDAFPSISPRHVEAALRRAGFDV